MKCAFTPSVRVSEIALVKTLGREKKPLQLCSKGKSGQENMSRFVFQKPAKRRGLEKARKNELKSDGTHGTTQKKTEELQGDVERREAAMAPCLIPLQQREFFEFEKHLFI